MFLPQKLQNAVTHHLFAAPRSFRDDTADALTCGVTFAADAFAYGSSATVEPGSQVHCPNCRRWHLAIKPYDIGTEYTLRGHQLLTSPIGIPSNLLQHPNDPVKSCGEPYGPMFRDDVRIPLPHRSKGQIG